ncbi:MAG: MFS transporter [Bacteroidota bacterium]|nr:MFS transporter [Bacteroidota bacterium]MDP4193890.1 MFS transporter [Bacteroidota bacterium]
MKKTSLITIFMTVFIDLLGFGLLIPILPTFASKEIHVSDFAIGILFAVFSLVQFIFNPILGKLSDKFGRRPLILISLSSTCISYIIFSFSHSYLMLFISRLMGGFGGSNIGVAQAYIADITEKHERTKGMGMIGVAFSLGFVFGPFVGGILSHFGYQVVGFVSAGFSLTALAFTFLFLKETVQKSEGKLKLRDLKIFDLHFTKSVLSHPEIGSLVFLFFIVTFSGANIYGTFALLSYKHYHFTDQQTGYLFGIMGISGALIQGGLIRILSEKISEKFLILAGTFILIFGLGLIPYGGNFLGLAIVMCVLSLGTGILQPTLLSMVSKYSPEKEQGAILGLNQSLSAFARVLGPLWGGFAFDFLGFQFPFLTGGAFMVLTFLFCLYLFNSKKFVLQSHGEAEKVIIKENIGREF